MKFKLFLLTAFASLVPLSASIAETPTTTPTIEHSQGNYKTAAPDWSKITWDTLPPVQQPGFLKIPKNLISTFGYDPSRSWTAGQKVDSVVMLGDADDAFKMSDLSLKAIDTVALPTTATTTKPTLKDFGLMQWQTPKTLVKAMPELSNLSLSEVPPLADLFSKNGGGTISQAISSNRQAADLTLDKIDLSKYSLNSIPGLTKTQLVKFEAWQQAYVNQIPKLSQVPFDKMPQPISSGIDVVGIASVVLGTAEKGDAKAGNNYFVSGSVVRGDAYGDPSGERTVSVACPPDKECSYLEMGDFAGSEGSLYGKRWASGSSQQVKGGYGILAAVNGGKEPTGRLVYGSGFKVALTGVNESKGTADFGLFFRICARPPFQQKTCTPYFIGPVPWLPVSENDLVIVGTGR
ncbi:hypothetical protein PQG02_33640 (plasmid) [Nostoc sp. UHCC 0926]|uniref:hypothetical protein n=1 Tax=Nostoc sp. UHCC 0926 TaxID=3025190 RepID=UPI00235DF921|nr:hypothetical protein [Nostoc sp. UHCC 0926]WDD36796.1 hypothetical protein PQG02_33640 [Nostoc sp. UHCC 0926]